MSKVKVQCKGSGLHVGASLNATRAVCPICHRMRDLTGAGKIKRHDKITTKSKLKRTGL
jgi:hypothetical protein